MRRMIGCLLVLALLVLPVRAAEKQYAALTFNDGPGRGTQKLLEGLAFRGVRATFLLRGSRMEQYPELTEEIFRQGHEIGFRGYSGQSMETMSRRHMGQELMDARALLPRDCEPVFFRPPGGVVTDGVRQVAGVRGLAILSWSADLTGKGPAAAAEDVRDGDILLLEDHTAGSVEAALALVDRLQQRGFRLVTVSELARVRRVSIRPGQIFQSFPGKKEKPGK